MKMKISSTLHVKYHEGKGNYGDQLNKKIWPLYIKDRDVKLRQKTILYGIGTILSKSNADPGLKIIFGSGVGYGEFPRLTEEWFPYCVRGPKTAEALGLPQTCAVTDPAILVADFFGRKTGRSGIAFFPHESSLRRVPWKKYCDWLGLEFISPRWSVAKVNRLIATAKFVVSEAMHGAIVADALRVPWLPIKMNSSILEFKWEDWCYSMDLDYQPVNLGDTDLSSRVGKIKWRVKAPLMLLKLKSILKNCNWMISTESVHRERLKKIKERMDMLKKDLQLGRLRNHWS